MNRKRNEMNEEGEGNALQDWICVAAYEGNVRRLIMFPSAEGH